MRRSDQGAPAPGNGESVGRVGSLWLDAAAPLPSIDLGAADEWRVLITCEGTAVSYIRLGDPGRTRRPEALLRATLGAHADRALARERISRVLGERMGAPPPPRSDLECSVVVCTHRRPRLLAGVLESLGRLDPAPLEILVVDNDPGAGDCREIATQAGARYVREDRRGLNIARARGVREAHGELIAFTDDDCLVPPGWLRDLGARFFDPTVAAVTGPIFPHELETVHQVRREAVAPFIRVFERRRYDWTNVTAVHAGSVGAGANMVLRRAAIANPEEVFPPELDAGTRTRSGGDLYALYKLLAAGQGIVYEPGAFIFHRHGREAESLLATVDGYGIGLSSFLTRAMVADREPGTFKVWRWLWTMYVEASLDALSGRGDREVAELRRRYLRAGMRGPVEWMRARRELRRAASAPTPRRPRAATATAGAAATVASASTSPGTSEGHEGEVGSAGAGEPVLSVIVAATEGDPDLAACLRALAGRNPGVSWEIVAVSPRPVTGADRVATGDGAARWVQAPGGPQGLNAGVAAARGRILLLLAGDSRPAPGLLRAHLGCHATGGDRVAIGYSPHRPPGRRLAALRTRSESEDRHRLVREAAARTCVDFELTNLSLPKPLFERIGDFDPRFDVRASWEWGARVLSAGVEAPYLADAEAPLERKATTRDSLDRAYVLGRSEAMLVSGRPDLQLGAVVERRPASRGVLGRLTQATAIRCCRRPPGRRAALALLNLLEALKLRRQWHGLATLARRGAYEHGYRAVASRATPPAPVETVELASVEPIAAPRVVAPRVRLTLRGEVLAEVDPPGGHWHPAQFDQAIAKLDSERLRALRASPEGGDQPAAVELGELEVLTGAWRSSGGDRPRGSLSSDGLQVRTVQPSRNRTEAWTTLDRALRESTARLVAIPLPGTRVSPAALAPTAAALEGDRVAAAVLAGLPADRPARPVEVFVTPSGRMPADVGRLPARVLIVDREHFERLGGFDPGAAAVGIYGPLLDFVQRALVRGHAVAYHETPGLDPPHRRRPESTRRWARAQARGGLIAVHAVRLGGMAGLRWFAGAGLLNRARHLHHVLSRRRPTLLTWIAGSAAFATGVALAIFDLPRRARASLRADAPGPVTADRRYRPSRATARRHRAARGPWGSLSRLSGHEDRRTERDRGGGT